MKHYQELSIDAQEMVDDMVEEMCTMDWPARRRFIAELVEIGLAVLGLHDPEPETYPEGFSPHAEQVSWVIGGTLAATLECLGIKDAECHDSALLLAISADHNHRLKAQEWFQAHPDRWQALQQVTN